MSSDRKGSLKAWDYEAAAWWLDCEEEAIQAVSIVEIGPWGAWRPSGEPTILFERHVFHRLTEGRFSGRYPDISNPAAGGYGPVSSQHLRLSRAAALDRNAALQSASWGAFQVLGRSYGICGYRSVQELVNDAYHSTSAHLRMFCRYILGVRGLPAALRSKDWETVAVLYNGPGHAMHNYAGRMAAAYAKLKG